MDEEICRELAEKLNNAPRGKKQQIISAYAKLLKASPRTVYRWARKGGFDSGRQGRSGGESPELPIEKLEKVADLIHATASKKYAPKISTERAIRLGIQDGFIEPGELTVDMVNNYMREHYPRKSANDVRPPHIPRRPDHINQVGQFDVSVCAQFYLKTDSSVGFQESSIYWTKNKRGRGPVIRRAIYCEVVTHAFWVEYYLGEESIEKNVPVLWNAWSPKADESKYPLKGMPDILIADKGSGLNNKHCKNLFENLGVDFRTHAPGHPWAKGSVESLMWRVECEIESLLKFDPAKSVEDLNRKIQPMLIELNGVKEHSRYGMPRSMAFASWIKSEHLRMPPKDLDHFLSLARREYDRVIDSKLSVQFQGKTYSFLGDPENYSDPAIMALKGQRVTVMHSPFDKDRVKIVTKDGQIYYPALVKKDRFGYPSFAVRMKAPGSAPKFAKPEWQENIERAQNAEPPKLKNVFVNDDLLNNLRFIVRPGQDFEDREEAGDSSADLLKIPRLEAKKKLQERLDRKLSKEESAHLNNVWAEMVSDAEIEAALRELQPQIDYPETQDLGENEGMIETA